MDRVRQPLVLLVAVGHLAPLPRAEGDIFRPRRPLIDGDEHEANLFSAAAKRFPGGRRCCQRGRGDQDDPEEPARSHRTNYSARLTWFVTSDIDSLATGDNASVSTLCARSLSFCVCVANEYRLTFPPRRRCAIVFLFSRSLGCYLRCRHLERKPIVIIMGGRRTRSPTPRLSLTHSLSGED